MIIATPLDLPIIEPDNWNTFWDIWNTNANYLTKVSSNVNDYAKVGLTGIWKGIDIYKNNNGNPTYSAPYVNIEQTLPKLYNTCTTLPFKNIFRVRLMTSLVDIPAHTDESIDKWAVRAYFYYTDPGDQWYFKKPNLQEDNRCYLKLPKETNWFAYNDKFCWHGTIQNPKHPKILLQVMTTDDCKQLANESMEKYKEYTISFNE